MGEGRRPHDLLVQMLRDDNGALAPWTLPCSTCGLLGLGAHGSRHLAYFASDENSRAIEEAGVHVLDEVALLTPMGLAELAVQHVTGPAGDRSAFAGATIERLVHHQRQPRCCIRRHGALQMLL